MRIRRTALILILLVLGTLAALRLADHNGGSDKPAIAITVLGYTNWQDYLCPRIRLTNKGNSTISYYCRATGPSGWMRLQSAKGWVDEPLSSMTGAPMLLQPGSNMVFMP